MIILPAPRRRGWTLFTLLVVFAIIALLLGLLVPMIARVREAAGRTQSANNLKQMAIAIHAIHDAHNKFPPAVGNFPAQTANKRGTLFFHILPYIEQNNLYTLAQGDVTKNAVYAVRIPVFVNPEDKTGPPDGLYKGFLATTSYAANWMVFRSTDGGTTSFRDIRDGSSNTIAFAERYQVCHGNPCAWGYSSVYYWAPMFAYYTQGKFQNMPSQEECDPALAQATRPSGIQLALVDGSVRNVLDQVSPQTWSYATDPADGMMLGPDW